MIRALLTITLFIIAGAVTAKPVVYYCEVNDIHKDGWIQPELVIGLDIEKDQAFVSDAFIMYALEKPAEAEITNASAAKNSFKWEVRYRNRSGQYARLRYKASLFENGKFVMQMKPLGYTNQFNARGSCKPSNIKIPGFN